MKHYLAQNTSVSSTGSDIQAWTPYMTPAIFFGVLGGMLVTVCTLITLVRFTQRRCAYSEQNFSNQNKAVEADGQPLQVIIREGESTRLLPPEQNSSFFRPSTRGLCPKSTGSICGDFKDSIKEGLFGAVMACISSG